MPVFESAWSVILSSVVLVFLGIGFLQLTFWQAPGCCFFNWDNVDSNNHSSMSVLWCQFLSDITSAVFVIDVPSSAVSCLTMLRPFHVFHKFPTSKQSQCMPAKHHNWHGSYDADFKFGIILGMPDSIYAFAMRYYLLDYIWSIGFLAF